MKTTRRQFLIIAGGASLSAVAAPRLIGMSGISLQTAHAQAIPGAPTFRGAAGKSIQGPVTLAAGLVVLRAQHNGTSNFSVNLLLPDPNETAQQSVDDGNFTDSALMYNEVGTVRGGAATLAGTPGDHYFAVDASGAFQFSVEQPLPENVAPVQQTTFSGRGNDITPYFTLPAGLTSLSVQTSADQFRGWLYHLDDLGGAAVTDGINVYDGRFFDFTFPDSQTSYPVNLPDAGPYLLVANNMSTAIPWTFTFQ